jgi:hypothetical protein
MYLRALLLLSVFVGVFSTTRRADADELRLEPAVVELIGAEARQQLLATVVSADGEQDVTDQVAFVSSDPKVAAVSSDGVVLPVADGTATITATYRATSVRREVAVRKTKEVVPLHFGRDIVPILTKASCNSGGCHGKQNGQNGFRLSVFGYDEQADYQALTQEGRGRRLFPAAPENSLLLLKAVNELPHGGGMRLEKESAEYRRMLSWIRAGMPRGAADTPDVTKLEVSPTQRVLRERATQHLLVTAIYSDGTRRDVTHQALFTSNDEKFAVVDRDGRVTTNDAGGEGAIVVRFGEHTVAGYFTVPLKATEAVASSTASSTATSAGRWDRSGIIDRLVAEKWDRLRLAPSPPADDATWLRRVYLDLIGKLPTADEVRAFSASTDPQRRQRLIDELLNRDEHADFWALKWADMLRVNRDDLGPKSAYHYHQWLRRAWRENKPYDRLIRELITAQGSSERNWEVNFYKAFKDPNDLTVAVSQVFLGIRLECAKCHHHPYEKWGQDDFYSFAAFFPRLQRKNGAGSEVEFYVSDKGAVKHPRTQEEMTPRVLLGDPLETKEDADPRRRLADWMTSPENPYVARAFVNRVWANLMGRGLVEPIDDMRETNPATNEPLLQALAQDFIAHGYDMRHLIRSIVSSQAYALASTSEGANARDLQNYSRAYRKRLSAEVLFDAVCDVTEQPEEFAGIPPGTRAVQLWDHRLPSAFLDTFGRPQRKTICQCERYGDLTLTQVLHLLNAPLVNDKITSPTGRAARLAASELSEERIIEELYLTTFARLPRPEELAAASQAFRASGATRRSAVEDILWALMNSAEFVLNH